MVDSSDHSIGFLKDMAAVSVIPDEMRAKLSVAADDLTFARDALGLKDAEIERLHDLHFKRTKLTHKALLEVAELKEERQALWDIRNDLMDQLVGERKRIEQLEDALGQARAENKRLTKKIADVASYESAAQRHRIEQLEAALRECIDTVKIFHGPDAWDIYESQSPEMLRWGKLLFAGDSDPCANGHDLVSRGDGTAKCADCGERTKKPQTTGDQGNG